MNRQELLNQINEIFKEVLDNEEILLSEQSTADDVEEWDSLSHIQLIVAIEKFFKIRFTSREIQSWENIGELISSVETKL